MHFKNKQKFTKGWGGGKDALASAKTFNVKPQQAGSKGSRITDPKSGCMKDIQIEIFKGVGGFYLLGSSELN